MENLEYGETTIVVVEEGDGRNDALGDLPNWENMSLQEIIKTGYYWKKNTDGRWIPRPCEWKDGNSQINYEKTNNGDDIMTAALRRMAATQKSLIKCGLTDEIINAIKPEMDLDEACEFALKGKKQAFIETCSVVRAELKTLKKEANLAMAEYRSKIPMKDLCERLKAFAIKTRDSENKTYEYRVFMANKAVASSLSLCEIQENKAIATFVNRYYWAMVTGKLNSDAEELANQKFSVTPALKGCMERYLASLKDYTNGVENDNHRQDPEL